MKIYNKFVESKKEPSNKNDIWFDGEYINLYKEGEWKAFTVPFNALDKSMEIPRLGEFVKRITKDDLGTSFEVKYASKLIFVINDKIKVLKVGETIHLESYGPSSALDLSLEAYGSSVILTISNMSNVDMLSGYTIDIYKTITKLRKEFLPDDIGGADWNAQEGEAGYIKNKLFRFIDAYANEYKFTNPLKREDFIPEVDEYGGVYKYKKSIDADYLQYVVCNKKMSEYGNLYDTAYYPVERTGNRFYVNLSEYGGYVYITEEYNEEADYNNYWLIVEVFNSNAFFPENSVYVIDSYEDLVTLETLSEYYLPDTILKTTPQTLSNTAKNQALANLGIDPVVWKYMCEPYTIIPSTEIPIDLHNIIYDATNGKLKQSIINLANIKPFSDDAQYAQMNGIYSLYKVNSNAIYINISEEGVYMYQYNPQTRKFEEYS